MYNPMIINAVDDDDDDDGEDNDDGDGWYDVDKQIITLRIF